MLFAYHLCSRIDLLTKSAIAFRALPSASSWSIPVDCWCFFPILNEWSPPSITCSSLAHFIFLRVLSSLSRGHKLSLLPYTKVHLWVCNHNIKEESPCWNNKATSSDNTMISTWILTCTNIVGAFSCNNVSSRTTPFVPYINMKQWPINLHAFSAFLINFYDHHIQLPHGFCKFLNKID